MFFFARAIWLVTLAGRSSGVSGWVTVVYAVDGER